jgi:hypothetical protein
MLAIGISVLVAALSSSSASPQDPAAAAALSYARHYMVWTRGPSVQSLHVLPLRQLDSAVAEYVPVVVRKDINVADLVQQYGPNKRVALVVLSGAFNSLPPDEGVTINGGVVAIVDAKTDNVLLLTD